MTNKTRQEAAERAEEERRARGDNTSKPPSSGGVCNRCQDTGFSQHWVDAEGRSWARRCRCMGAL